MNAKLSATTAPSDTAVLTIEARHIADDVWFRAGHHDANGYIGMAHADRGALIGFIRENIPSQCQADKPDAIPDAALREFFGTKDWSPLCPKCVYGTPMLHSADCPNATSDQHTLTPTTMNIPRAAWDWLMGEGPDDEGNHFAEPVRNPGTFGAFLPVPRFWWRTTFRRMCGL